jgi:S-methylmethionine-dependent homocysteine/selenocysteine methylase
MSDMLLADALSELKKENVPLLNIMHTEVDIVSECLDVVDECWPNHIGVYAHSGIYKNPEWIFDGVISPSEYAKESEKWIERKINILGGCCGIGADHIKCINKILRSKSN